MMLHSWASTTNLSHKAQVLTTTSIIICVNATAGEARGGGSGDGTSEREDDGRRVWGVSNLERTTSREAGACEAQRRQRLRGLPHDAWRLWRRRCPTCRAASVRMPPPARCQGGWRSGLGLMPTPWHAPAGRIPSWPAPGGSIWSCVWGVRGKVAASEGRKDDPNYIGYWIWVMRRGEERSELLVLKVCYMWVQFVWWI